MLLDFLREIERKQRQEEISSAAEESKTISISNSATNEHRKEVVPDLKVAQAEPCGVCGENGHRYKCPRCGVLYCGIACF